MIARMPFILIVLGPILAHANVYIYNLGVLPAPYGHQSVSTGISSSGNHIVGQSGATYGDDSYLAAAYRFDGDPRTGGAMHELPLYEVMPFYGLDLGYPIAVNISGQVAAQAGQSFTAVRYDGTPGIDGQVRALTPGLVSVAYGINDFGSVAGSMREQNTTDSHAFRYDGAPFAAGTLHDLGTLGGTRSFALGINNTGQVVGSARIASGASRAFLYEGTPGIDGVMHNLGVPTDDYESSEAVAINSSGVIAGSARLPGDNGSTFAFRYDGHPNAGGTMRLFDSQGFQAFPTDINDAGFAVGRFFRSQRDFAALWRPDLSMVDIDAWLDLVDPLEGAHWRLEQLRGLSDTGLAVGYGLRDNQYRAFALDISSLVPEPDLAIALTALLFTMRRAHHITTSASASRRLG